MTAQPADNWSMSAIEFAVTEAAARYRAKEALRNRADPGLVAQALERFLANQERQPGLFDAPVVDDLSTFRPVGWIHDGEVHEYAAPTAREAMGYTSPYPESATTGSVYGTTPRARHTDPGTSHAAAASVTGIKPTQAHIIAIIHEFGGQAGLTDEEIAAYHTRMVDGGEMPPCSPSGLRTRRKELVDRGLLRDSGQRRPNGAGRSVVVWAEVR